MRIPPKTIVVHMGRTGVTCPDFVDCCLADETPVVFNGQEGFQGVKTNELEALGPENARPDPRRCGAGRGALCCKFLVVGPQGFECERFGTLRFSLMLQKMSASREPNEPYPGCFLPE